MKNTIMEYGNINPGKYIAQESVSLTLEQVNWAANLSQTLATDPRQQWQVYLNLLARLGTIEWLQQRAPELLQENDLLTESIQPSPQSTDQLKVGNFRLTLIVTDSSMNTEVCVPRVCLTHSQEQSQFYVLIEVLEDLPVSETAEEQVNVAVLGYLTPSQLNQHHPIILDDDLALLSIDWFELNPDQLLLYLRCFEAETVSDQPSIINSQQGLSPVVQSTVNVGHWLKNKLGEMAEELSWTLLPPLSYSSAFRALRSPVEVFSDAVIELSNQAQLVIPLEARTAYRDFTWGEVAMRLYATTWQIDTDINSPEWTLLLLLTAQPNSSLPLGTQLIVRDQLQVLENPSLDHPQKDYIYARVIGAYNEPFYVTINFPNQTAITLPPFTFYPEFKY